MFKTCPHPERGGGEGGRGRKETIRLKSVEVQVHVCVHIITVKDKKRILFGSLFKNRKS